MPVEYPYLKYRHDAGTTVVLTCMLDDDDSPASLPIVSQIVWLGIQKQDDSKWLDFSAGTFTGTDPNTSGCQQKLVGHADGTYQLDFNPRSYSAIGPQGFLMRYDTSYSFSVLGHAPDQELHYFYGTGSGSAPAPPAHDPP